MILLLAELILLILFFVYMDKVSFIAREQQMRIVALGLGQAKVGSFPGQKRGLGKQLSRERSMGLGDVGRLTRKDYGRRFWW